MHHRQGLVSSALVLAVGVLLFISLNGWTWLNDPVERHILVQLRLPVLVTAIVVGAALSISAALLQVLLRNPLADPGIIGISSGASLCAALVLLTPLITVSHQYLLPLACFIGASCSALIIFYVAKRLKHNTSAVILAGIGVSTLCAAIIGWLYLFAPPQGLQSLTFWLMGSLHNTNWSMLALVVPVFFLALMWVFRHVEKLNWLYLGEYDTKLKGLDSKRFQYSILIVSSLLVAISVSIAGGIAFIGLLVPHFTRQWLGHDNRLVVGVSGLLGASVLVTCALLNDILMHALIPISMLTATIGGPLFLWALLRNNYMRGADN